MQSAWDIYFNHPEKFDLGFLPTEQSHPKSIGLAEVARQKLDQAFAMFRDIDHDALDYLLEIESHIDRLREVVQKAFVENRNVFLCGCGATGRLSLFLESWSKEHFPEGESILSFMAGGDYALVRSVEGMEDHPGLGARHLLEVGYRAGDYLISFTEGGETPYVIGATEKAAELSPGKVIFLFCNPADLLEENIERSASVLQNKGIHSLSLGKSPMALSGSTRLQATTVLTLVGAYLLQRELDQKLADWIGELKSNLTEENYTKMVPLTREESEIYKRNEFVNYISGSFSLTVLTDTTERSPTFSLTSFENSRFEGDEFSWCYLFVPGTHSAKRAWENVLRRPVRALDWPELEYRRGEAYLGFDMSEEGMISRKKSLPSQSHDFRIELQGQGIELTSPKIKINFRSLSSNLLNNLFLKVLLNAHSTLLMTLMGRAKSNVMTYVRPSNAKLIDRSIRYINYLLLEESINLTKGDIAKILKAVLKKEASEQALVIRTFDIILQNRDHLPEFLQQVD